MTGPLVVEHWWNGNWGRINRRVIRRLISPDGVDQLRIEFDGADLVLDYATEADAVNALGLLLTEFGPWSRLGRAAAPDGGPPVRYVYHVELTRYGDTVRHPTVVYRAGWVAAETGADAARLVAERVVRGELDGLSVAGAHVPVDPYAGAGFSSCRVVQVADEADPDQVNCADPRTGPSDSTRSTS